MNKLKKHIKIILASVVVGALAVLLFTTISTQTGYDMTVSELVKQKSTMEGKFVRMEGNVDQSSAKWDARDLRLQFDVIGGPGIKTDKKVNPKDFPNADRITIVYKGPKPDNFEEAITAIVEGKLNNKGQFEADKLMVKCPSKYESKQEQSKK